MRLFSPNWMELRGMPAATLSLVVLLSACSARAPPLGRGLAETFDPASPYFGTRLKERFPVGSDAAKLFAELRNEGFVVEAGREPDELSARYEAYENLVCKESWVVHWRAEHGRIASISGSHNQACL